MKTYSKGFRAERDLLRILSANGYSCIRAGSSGGFLTPVDVVAIKDSRILCFEIKSWAKKPRLDKTQLSRFSDWTAQASGLGFVAWYNQAKWRFLPMSDALENNYDDENWVSLDAFLKVFI